MIKVGFIGIRYLNWVLLGISAVLVIKTLYNTVRARSLDRQVEILRSSAFFKLLVNFLTMVFLAPFFLKITLLSNLKPIYASILYVIYILSTMITIIPSGIFVEIKNLKIILVVTSIIESLIYFGFSFATSFWQLLILQILFGILRSISSASEYAYLFRISNTVRKTHSSISLYTVSITGAVIAGSYFSGALVGNFGLRTCFFISGVCLVFISIFIMMFLKNIKLNENRLEKLNKISVKFISKTASYIFKDKELMHLIFFIAIPLGVIEDGVIMFSLPIVLLSYLHNHMVAKLISIMAVGFLGTNYILSKWIKLYSVDRVYSTKYISFAFMCLSMSIILIAFIENKEFGLCVVFFALFLIGVFKGFIVAPLISTIAYTKTANVFGKNIAMSVYKFAHNFGKILGPILCINLFVFVHYSATLYIFISIFFTILALISVLFF